MDEVKELSINARKRIREFVETIDALREKAREVNAFEIVQEVVNTFRLLEIYQGSRLPEDQARVENIQELLNSILTFTRNNPPEEATLTHYLEEISLVTDIDRWDPSQATVTLMTLHSAKGLEFPVVIITGLEDGLFPLARSVNRDEDLEEERRLFYVGMTRAKESLYLLWAQERQRFGNQQWGGGYFYNAPSRFLREIPEHLTKEEPVKIQPDLEYIYDDQEDEKGEFRIGDWVVHDKFGKGQVLAVENSPTGTKVKVFFETKGLKTLVTEYANLRPWREG
ncbi:MAG: hypothetical protein D6681_09095 [Calditrichaeota bacterium]|nr:MAG: hypothetical protein D6681_09095 [Calditrichota bacterium]